MRLLVLPALGVLVAVHGVACGGQVAGTDAEGGAPGGGSSGSDGGGGAAASDGSSPADSAPVQQETGSTVPALACAAIALVLSVVTGGGIIDPVLSGLWHGAVVYGLTGVAGATRKSRKRTA